MITRSHSEKIIMLEEGLFEKEAITTKGMKIALENYEWMVETIKKKYDDATTRASIIKRFTNLEPAREHSSDTAVFEESRPW